MRYVVTLHPPPILKKTMDDYGRLQPQTRQYIQQLREHLAHLQPEEQARIENALQLMLYAHEGQNGRFPNQEFAQHPLKVALHLIEVFGVAKPDLIIAALLHDSVEDQPARLLHTSPYPLPTDLPLREQALRALAARFGERVAQLVGWLTNPDFASLMAQQQAAGYTPDKNALYQQHVMHIFAADPEAFTIKMADFAQNALQLGAYPQDPRRPHFQQKYGPVMLQLMEKLPLLDDPEHPLFAQRSRLVAELTAVYQRDYASHPSV